MNQFDFDRVVEELKPGWIADTASLCRVLDHRGFNDGETIHFLDAATLPEESRRHVVAWTAPGLDRLLDDGLTGYRRRGPVVVLDASLVVRGRRDHASVSSEKELKVVGRLECQQVGIHEFAHVRCYEATGGTLPDCVTWPLVLEAVATPPKKVRRDSSHGLDWLRAYIHLSHRAAAFWPYEWWLDVGLSWDVLAHGLGCSQAFVEALKAELDASADERLIDVLRREPPAAFTDVFQSRVALRDAARLSA